jgi:AraC-like DNA-binding protein
MNSYLKKEGFIGQKFCVLTASILKKAQNHPLCKGLYITDIGYYPKAKFHYRERKKGSKQYVLIYCVKGAGWYQIKDEKFQLSANQMVILPQKIPHKYGANAENPWTIYWLHFAGEYAVELMNHILLNDSYQPVPVLLSEERNTNFEKLLLFVEMANNMDNMIDAFLTLPYYLNSFRDSGIKSKMPSDEMGSVAKSIVFMKSRLNTMISLKSLAEHVSLSASHYSALFQKQTHFSPINYFIYLKMQYSCQLLENTKLSVKQIGNELGYTDPFHFSRTFSKVVGVSPRAFRLR